MTQLPCCRQASSKSCMLVDSYSHKTSLAQAWSKLRLLTKQLMHLLALIDANTCEGSVWARSYKPALFDRLGKSVGVVMQTLVYPDCKRACPGSWARLLYH